MSSLSDNLGASNFPITVTRSGIWAINVNPGNITTFLLAQAQSQQIQTSQVLLGLAISLVDTTFE